MKPEDLLGKGAFEKKKTISADLELKASDLPYAIIPCTFYPNTENAFSVSVTPSTSPSDVRLKACTDDWRKAVASVSTLLFLLIFDLKNYYCRAIVGIHFIS
jgi:hypothetical protein